jgi:hypothetical protein
LKPKLYLNKNTAQLLKYRMELKKDIEFCDEKAAQLGFGAAADFYRKRSKETQDELTRVAGEIEHRGALQ